MADPFQPKFVDLVRNFTTTTGTGNFVLGPAANGYTSFTAACQVGDSFYYSAINADKPAEREVGRGTLLAGGSISRSPISGPKTNFTAGAKSIALIAAAEWFGDVQSTVSSLGALPTLAATRTALAAVILPQGPAILSEPGREGLFVWDGSNLSAKVAADSAQAIYVAPASDPSGALGAWVRKFDGSVNVNWFGAVGDDVTNDGPAFVAAFNYLNAIAVAQGGLYGYPGRSAPRLFIPAGRYFLGTSSLDLTTTLIIEGEGVGHESAQSTVLRWSAGATGIRIQSNNTSGDTTSGLSLSTSGSGSMIRNLALYGGWTGANTGDFHGILLRARATIQDVFIAKFQGDGVRIIADATTNNGNANGWRLERVVVQENRNGVKVVESGDVNAGHGIAVSAIGNREVGIYEGSFLGNTWIAGHSSSNTLMGYKSTQAAAANAFLGCYSESDEPASTFVAPTLVLGGTWGNSPTGVGRIQGMTSGQQVTGSLRVDNILTVFGNSNSFGPQSGAASDVICYLDNTNSASDLIGRRWNAGTPTTLGSLRFINGFGTYLNAVVGSVMFQNAGADVAQVTANGINILSGKDLRYNGTVLFNAGVLTPAAFPALTGDVTTTAGSLATTIAANAVSYAKMQDVAASRLLGNPTGAAADPSEISLGRGLEFSGTVVRATASIQASYRTILDSSGSHTAARAAGTYGFGHGDPLAISGTGTLYPLDIVYIDPADYPDIGDLTAKLRLRCVLSVNDVAPTGNYTIGLHPVTRPATSGGAGLAIYTLGAAVAGSTVTLATPAADSINNMVGTDFAVPAAGFYVIGLVTTAAVAASSHVHLSALLQIHHS